jgi:hypothetical protein
MDWWWKLVQGNSDIMIDSCTYIYIYIQVSVRDIILECLQITPTKFRGSKFPGNMHNYIWCPYYLWSFMQFCSVVSEELCWQAASELYFVKIQVQRGITPTKFRRSTFIDNMHNYIWCPYYLPTFMKFCSVVSEELRWQAASEVYLGKFLSSKWHNSHKV